MDLRELEQWYNERISPIQSRIDQSKQDHNQVINGMLSEHNPYQSPYQQFQQQYPQLDQYGRKVASGGYLRENIQNFDNAMANARGQAFEGQADTGQGNIMDYFAPAAMTAFHGSPHKFDKFSLEHIGKGEGAQAYGHGLYFAENPKVAGEYQKQLTSWQLHKPNGELFDVYEELSNPNIRAVLQKTDGDIDAAIQKAMDLQKSIPNTQGAEYALKDAEILKSIKESGGISRPSGHIYEVDIPDEHVKNFLDWDAPLSEQPESVRKAYKEFAVSPKGIEKAKNFHSYKEGDTLLDIPDLKDPYGETIYKNVLGWDNDELTKHGIKGIKYFDGSSRKAGEGTRNLVVFDDSIIKTLKRNNEDILPNMLKPQSGDGQPFKQTDKMPEMLKRQSR